MRTFLNRILTVGIFGLACYGGSAFAAGRVGTVYADGGRFFFQVENANYAGCGANRFVLSLADDTRQAMVLSAQATGRLVSVHTGGCINDGDTAVVVLYVH